MLETVQRGHVDGLRTVEDHPANVAAEQSKFCIRHSWTSAHSIV